MSFKRFDLDKETFTNNYVQYEGVRYFWVWMSGFAGETNIKLPNHYNQAGVSGSYFLEIYERPKNDISAVKVLTLTYGYSSSSIYYSGSGFTPGHAQHKLKMYRLMAKRLLGDEDKKFVCNGKEMNEAVFFCIPRNQYRDQVVPKSTKIFSYFSSSPGAETYLGDILTDRTSKVLSEFAGEYTLLRDNRTNKDKGLVFANAGICVVDPEVWHTGSATSGNYWSASFGYEVLAKGISGTSYNDLLWSIKNKIYFWDFSGSSRVESAFYKCTAQPDEFNYSSNPSFVTPQQEIKALISGSRPTTYITQIGLLGENNELLAVGKTYKPVKKDPTIGVTIYVRIDQ